MANKEKEYLSRLGTLYTYEGEKHISCGEDVKIYTPINLENYFKQCEYNEKLQTYMQYRNAKRFSDHGICGRVSMVQSDSGEYVMTTDGRFIDIESIKKQLKPEDIKDEVEELKKKYKYDMKYSWNPNIPPVGSFVPNFDKGDYIYDEDKQMFVYIGEY